MRYTEKDAQNSFNALARKLGKEVVTNEADLKDRVGKWLLECNSVYGYKVIEYLEGGGAGEPLGSTNRSAREFCDCVSFLLNALNGKLVTTESEQYTLINNSIKAFEGREKEREKCNGWTNYATWQIWQNIDSFDRNYWNQQAKEFLVYLKDAEKEVIEVRFADALHSDYKGHLGAYEGDDELAHCLLMNTLEKVDWLGISRHLIEEVENEEKYQEEEKKKMPVPKFNEVKIKDSVKDKKIIEYILCNTYKSNTINTILSNKKQFNSIERLLIAENALYADFDGDIRLIWYIP